MTLRSLLCVALMLGSAQAFAEATKYPLTIQSCNREVTFAQAPKHAVSHDINMTQMMLALGLKPRMAGYSGISGWKSVTPEMKAILDGLPELAKLIKKQLPKGIAQFPEDQISTAPMRFMTAEIIREKLFLHLRQEVPYSVAVDVENWEEDEERGQTVIHATIYVARPMHKAMVIGRAGQSIKVIGTEARKDIQTLVGGKVHLELWVKVREHWTEDAAFLRELGLMAE